MTSSDHQAPRSRDLGAEGFSQGELYDAARPSYPEEALDYLMETLHLDQNSFVVDLGAGTGIFTRQVQPRVRRVMAVEPSASMRATFVAQTRGVDVLDGSDVAIPVSDHHADAVLVAQAFHWFDAARALREIHRVVVAGGGLGLLWNERDATVEWIRDLDHAMRWDVVQPYDSRVDYTRVVASGPFVEVGATSFRHRQNLTHEQVRRRVLSTSYITLMDDDERSDVMASVAQVLAGLPDPVEMPYVTDVISAVAAQ